MFAVGDVIHFYSKQADKHKYHLCISFSGHFLFLNSPKKRIYPGDFVVPCSDLPCPVTESGMSIISCSLVMTKTDAELRQSGARKIGVVTPQLLGRLRDFVRSSPILSEEEKDNFYEAAGDWI